MRLICVLLTVFALGVTPAYADNPPEFEPVTDCEMVPHKGQDLCGLTLDEWKRVLKTNRTLEHKSKLLHTEQQKNSILEQQKKLLIEQLAASQKNQSLLIAREHKLTDDLIALDKKYQNERVKPRLGDPWAWTVAGISASVLVGFVAYKALD